MEIFLLLSIVFDSVLIYIIYQQKTILEEFIDEETIKLSSERK